MSNELKVGDRVRVMYWEELPRSIDWNWEYFRLNGGKVGRITEIDSFNEETTLDIRFPLTNRRIININALKKIEHIPEELFQID